MSSRETTVKIEPSMVKVDKVAQRESAAKRKAKNEEKQDLLTK